MVKRGIVKSIPVINRIVESINKGIRNYKFKDSLTYWEERYRKGGNSGGGSYNHLAEFKARILNQFVNKQKIQSIIEFGCGDGNQLSLANYPNYIGLDVSETAISLCINKFKGDPGKSFFLYNSFLFADHHQVFRADLTLSLDVIYHLVEDDIFEKYMVDLFHASNKFVIIYSSNFEGKQDGFCRSREFTRFVEKNLTEWNLKEIIKNEYPFKPDFFDAKNTSWADFYIYEKL